MQSVLDAEVTRIRAMTASEKLGVMHLLWRQAWSLVFAGVQGRHPDWTREQVEVEVRRIMGRDTE